ncbi:hypothetical protein [Parafrankia sp. CH37]|nr:hypothetical protein [Parafrankia sp. CH37]
MVCTLTFVLAERSGDPDFARSSLRESAATCFASPGTDHFQATS